MIRILKSVSTTANLQIHIKLHSKNAHGSNVFLFLALCLHAVISNVYDWLVFKRKRYLEETKDERNLTAFCHEFSSNPPKNKCRKTKQKKKNIKNIYITGWIMMQLLFFVSFCENGTVINLHCLKKIFSGETTFILVAGQFLVHLTSNKTELPSKWKFSTTEMKILFKISFVCFFFLILIVC